MYHNQKSCLNTCLLLKYLFLDSYFAKPAINSIGLLQGPPQGLKVSLLAA